MTKDESEDTGLLDCYYVVFLFLFIYFLTVSEFYSNKIFCKKSANNNIMTRKTNEILTFNGTSVHDISGVPLLRHMYHFLLKGTNWKQLK